MSKHDVQQQVAVKAVVRNKEGKVLLLRESPRYARGAHIGKWDFPGGKIQPGETIESTIYRKVSEECGLSAFRVGRPVYVGEWSPMVQGVKHQIIGIFFECIAESDEILLGDNYDSYGWVHLGNNGQYHVIEPNNQVLQLYYTQEMSDVYDAIAQQYNKRISQYFWSNEFTQYKQLVTGTRIIDIGCGVGRDAPLFIESGFDYVGVDVSQEMLRVAQKHVPEGVFYVQDFHASSFLFPENAFDGFWAVASLLHLPKHNVSHMLQEIKKITRPNGIGFIAVQEKQDVDEGIRKEDRYDRIGRYYSYYEKDEFKSMLEQNGFDTLVMTEHLEEQGKNWLCYFVQN